MISKNKKILMHLFIIFLIFFGFQSHAEENQNTIEIKNPIFTTKSIDGSPYEIKAEKGLQRENYLDLFVIEAKLKTNNDIWIYLNADRGTFNQSNGEILLENNIEIYTETDEKIFAELANVNTNGFKRDRANFESLLYQIIRSCGAQTSVDTELTSGFSVGTGVNIVNSNKLHSQGSIVSTDNSLDLAVDGGGFFQVLLPDGAIVYTRNGAFARNNEGTLTTSSISTSGISTVDLDLASGGTATLNVGDGTKNVTIGVNMTGLLTVNDHAVATTSVTTTPPSNQAIVSAIILIAGRRPLGKTCTKTIFQYGTPLSLAI